MDNTPKYSLIIFIFFIFLYSFIAEITTDYAWYINRVDWYAKSHIFYDAGYNIEGAWESFITLLNAYTSKLFGNSYISYWILGLVYSLLSIFVLLKLLQLKYNKTFDNYLGVTTYILLTFFTNIYIGARPENIYASSIVFVIYFLYKSFLEKKYIWVYIASIFASFGVLSHPNGLILLIILFIFAVKMYAIRRLSWFHLLNNLILVSTLLYLGFFFGQSHEHFLSLLSSISSDTGHSTPFYYEPKRYLSFLFEHMLIAPLFLFTLFTLFLYLKQYLFSFKNYFFENLLALTSLFIIIYLTILGVKWESYLSLLFPFITISFVEFTTKKSFNKKSLLVISSVIMLIIIGQNFKKNENFISLLPISSKRVIVMNEIISMLQGSDVYAPMRLFPLYQYHNRFIPLERENITDKKFDFIILDFSRTKQVYDKKLSANLSYIRSFVYQNQYYNIFRVNYAK